MVGAHWVQLVEKTEFKGVCCSMVVQHASARVIFTK